MKKPRPPKKVGHKRRAAGWTLLTFGVVVTGVWVASGWWWLDAEAGQLEMRVANGTASIEHWEERATRAPRVLSTAAL